MEVNLAGLKISSGDKKPDKPIDRSNVSEKDLFDLYGPRQEYMSWTSKPKLARTKLNPRTLRSLSIVGIVIGLILALMGEFFLLLLIVSVLFFVTAANKLEANEVRYIISNYGVMLDDVPYYWFNLKHFFMFDQNGEEVLAIDTTLSLPKRLFLSLPDQVNKEQLTQTLSQHLAQLQQVPNSVFDRTYTDIMNKFDL